MCSYFVAKMFLLVSAGLNMAIFHLFSAREMKRWGSGIHLPFRAKLAGGLSIVLWIAVVACGRWIGFTMLVR